MEIQLLNDSLESLTLEQIDALQLPDVIQITNNLISNTDWSDSSKHVTTNGSGMNC